MRRLPAKLAQIPSSDSPLPVEYQAAVAAISACRTFDEADGWSNKADALAAWAKIFANDEVEREAKSLKLQAHRRMGVLAKEIALIRGEPSSAYSILREYGYKKSRATAAVKISKMPQDQFDAVSGSDRPPSPSVLCTINLRANPEWARLAMNMRGCLAQMRPVRPFDVARRLSQKEVETAFAVCRELLFWMVPFHDELKARRQSPDTPPEKP